MSKLIKIKGIGKAKLLTDPNDQSKGLMLSSGNVLMKFKKESRFETSIHTFFCKPLIVAWLNKNLKVIDIRKTIPFWFYMSKKPAMYIFESTNTKLKIKKGQKFVLK